MTLNTRLRQPSGLIEVIAGPITLAVISSGPMVDKEAFVLSQ